MSEIVAGHGELAARGGARGGRIIEGGGESGKVDSRARFYFMDVERIHRIDRTPKVGSITPDPVYLGSSCGSEWQSGTPMVS